MDYLAEHQIPLEVCPGSNMKTAALALQLGRKDARIEDHPLPKLLRHGIPVVLSTDDPAMFHTTLLEEYANAARMGLQEDELTRIVQMGFEHAFHPPIEKPRT
jgi:aminodeoxyfutalosine deaminase